MEKVLSEQRMSGLIIRKVAMNDLLLHGKPVVITRIIDADSQDVLPFYLPPGNSQKNSVAKSKTIR